MLLLEVLCLTGVIDRLTMPPPHRIVRDLAVILASRLAEFGAILKTSDQRLDRARAGARRRDRQPRSVLHGYRALRETLDPLFATYYAIPIFAFYPLFIVLRPRRRAADR